MKKLTSLTALLLSLTLASCGGGGGNTGGGTGGNNGGNNGGGTGNSDLRAKLAACPIISQPTSDISAMSCLAGTYKGTTPGASGAECTLIVSSNGSYSYSSPQLNYSYTVTGHETVTYGHTALNGNTHVLSWLISNLSSDPAYDLSFQSQFGPATTNKLQIDAKIVGGTSSNCMISL